jgi:hypothetical protein
MTTESEGKPEGEGKGEEGKPEGEEEKVATLKLGDEGKEYTAEQVEGALRHVGGLNKELREQLEEVKKNLATALESKKESKPGKEVDLERLSRKDLVEHITSLVGEKTLKPIMARLDEMDASSSKKSTADEIKALEKKDSQFWDWEPEIREVLKEQPDLSITRALAIAKSESPDKATRLAEALAKKKKGANGDEGKPFGGMTPTSGRQTKSTKMQPKTAAEKAYDEVGVDAVLASLEELS